MIPLRPRAPTYILSRISGCKKPTWHYPLLTWQEPSVCILLQESGGSRFNQRTTQSRAEEVARSSGTVPVETECKYVCTRAPNPNDTLKGDSDRVLSRGLVSQILHHPVSDHVSIRRPANPGQQCLFNGLLQPAAAVEIRSVGVAHTCPGCTDPARGPACTHGTGRPAHPRLFHPCRGHRRPRRSRPSGGGGVRRGCGRARPSRRQPSFASSRTTETLFSAIGEREGSTLVSSSWRRQ